MRRLNKIILSAIMLFCCGFGAFGQQRHCNFSTTLIEPQDSAVIGGFVTLDIVVRIKNLGPDSLKTGDTLYYNIPTLPLFIYNTYVLQTPIAPGQQAQMQLDSILNFNENNHTVNTDFCVTVISNPEGGGRFVDDSTYDNVDCHEVTFESTSGIKDLATTQKKIRIVPNPASRFIRIILSNKNFQPRRLVIRNVFGQVDKAISIQGGQKNISINIQQLPSGMYFVEAQGKNWRAVQKLIKR